MAENPDYRELLQLLNQCAVDYLIVGGFAVMKYGEPRYTNDLDLWIHNSAANSLRLVEALKKFGAPLEHENRTVAADVKCQADREAHFVGENPAWLRWLRIEEMA